MVEIHGLPQTILKYLLFLKHLHKLLIYLSHKKLPSTCLKLLSKPHLIYMFFLHDSSEHGVKNHIFFEFKQTDL